MEKYYSESQLSIFEQACQTPDRAEFIYECIQAGCDVNKVIYYREIVEILIKSLIFIIKKVEIFHLDSATNPWRYNNKKN